MKKWRTLNLKIYDPFKEKSKTIKVEGILKDGQIIKRAAHYAIMVEKHGIRDILVEHLKKLEKKGKVKNIELYYNVFALDWMVYFSYENKEILLMHPVMGAPSAECLVQQAYTIGCSHFVRLGTTGSLSTEIPMYSVISTIGAIRHDGTSDHYLPQGFPAIPDIDFQKNIYNEIKDKVIITEGISYTTQTRFRENINDLLNLNKDLGVLNIEMESATVFSVARTLNMKAASLSMVSDCLASEEDTKHVEGTLRGVPTYEDYFDKGIKTILQMFEAILKSFPENVSINKRYNQLINEIEYAKKGIL